MANDFYVGSHFNAIESVLKLNAIIIEKANQSPTHPLTNIIGKAMIGEKERNTLILNWMTIIVKSSETSKTLFTFSGYVQNAEQNKKQFYFIHKYIHWNRWRESLLPSIALNFSILLKSKMQSNTEWMETSVIEVENIRTQYTVNTEHWNLSSTAPTARSTILSIINIMRKSIIIHIIISIMSFTDFFVVCFKRNKTEE